MKIYNLYIALNILKSYQADHLNGLKLELFIGVSQNQNKDVSYFIEGTGVRLLIYNQSDYPLLDNGITAASGISTYISLKKVISKNEPEPYSDCKDLEKVNSPLYEELTRTNQLKYQQRLCIEHCKQKRVVKQCGCKSPFLVIFAPNNESEYCKSDHEYFCYKRSLSDRPNEECLTLCPLECVNQVYEITTTHLSFPSLGYFETLKTDPILVDLFEEDDMLFEDADYANVKESMVSLSVFFQDLKYSYVTGLITNDNFRG